MIAEGQQKGRKVWSRKSAYWTKATEATGSLGVRLIFIDGLVRAAGVLSDVTYSDTALMLCGPN